MKKYYSRLLAAGILCSQLLGSISLSYAGDSLFFAVADGDYSTVKSLIRQGECVNEFSSNQSPLHMAAFMGHFKIVKHLIKKKANVHAQDLNGQTPLHHAVKHAEFANSWSYDAYTDNTPSFFNFYYRWTAEALIAAGASVDQQDALGNTPLHLAVYKNDVNMVKLLLKRMASPDIKNNSSESPFEIAKRYGLNSEIYRVLYKERAKRLGF